VFDHFGRVGSRDRQLSNIAQDFAVNQILVDERIGEKITEVKICYDPKYRGLAWEEIYDQLYEKAEKIPMDQLLKQLGDLLDEHINEDGNSPGEGKEGEGKDGKPGMTKEEAQAIRDEIKEAMIQSAAAAGAGKVPAGIQRMIKDMTEPKMDWREMLRMNIQSLVKNDFSFSRPNRKGQMTGAVLPGCNFDTSIDVCVALDMSGSISDEMGADFLGEVKGIMQEFKDFNIKIWCFDTKVYNEQDYDSYNGDEIDEYEIMGGGGTEFDCNWDYMKDHDIRPKKFIMFTDGYPWSSWGDEDYCDTIFVIHGNDTIVPPFGSYAYYDMETSTA
jgi:predicted metal-dependent peptidase